jgi:hypothetical protein
MNFSFSFYKNNILWDAIHKRGTAARTNRIQALKPAKSILQQVAVTGPRVETASLNANAMKAKKAGQRPARDAGMEVHMIRIKVWGLEFGV